MIPLTHETRIVLCISPCDFRRGIDGFVAIAQQQFSLQPRDGSVIVFINRARTMIRALNYDVNGYWLMTKRLSRGKFKRWPNQAQPITPASARELRLILTGDDGQHGPKDNRAIQRPTITSSTSALASKQRSATVSPR